VKLKKYIANIQKPNKKYFKFSSCACACVRLRFTVTIYENRNKVSLVTK